ncbi:MAG: FHA domain-containing protein [Planctomycetota bacterium]
MARIIVIKPDKTRTEYQLDARLITIGRTPANNIQIDDGAASRKHCLIKAVGEAWTLVDLGSANGTKVNGERVKEWDLTDGDRIKIGKTVLAFKE